MKSNFLHVKELLENNEIRIGNKRMEPVIKNYSFLEISSVFNFENNQKIYQRMEESKVIIISEYEENSEKYFILVFKQTIISIKQTSVNFVQSLISSNKSLKICFLLNSKKSFEDRIQIQYEEIIYDEVFDEEITNFIKRISIRQRNDLFSLIIPCIAGYLIKSAYIKNSEDRLLRFTKNGQTVIQEKKYSKKEFINLRDIIYSGSASIELCYHIITEELFIIKTACLRDNKQIEREIENYRNMNHPFIPRYYGTIEGESNKSFVIEFIDGHPLSDISKKKMKMKDEEKLIIIFDLLCIFSYLKLKKYIYRDLKPNNVILYNNNQIVLIDFDSMISNKRLKEKEESEFTRDFSSDYIAPEINGEIDGIPSYQSDVYSLGKLILFILDEKVPKRNEETNCDDTTHMNELERIFKNRNSTFEKCLKEKPEERPTIECVIKDLLSILPKHHQLANFLIYKIKSNQYYAKELCNISELYFDKHNEAENKIAIHYLSIIADLNIPDAQFYLGIIYGKGEYTTRDIKKAIHYLSLASNQNYSKAQYNLGLLYYKAEYAKQNISKAIHYFLLAANQNHPKAQYYLGVIYYEGEYMTRNIGKAFHYFSLAANQNHPQAQYFLGVIYYEGEYITRDINKSIHYLSLAADQNLSIANHKLGLLYLLGIFVTRNIEKAIHYLSLAANQNHIITQYILGGIYYEGRYATQDINKSIHYFSLAANQNYPKAQFYLGKIYYGGQYIARDINKAIHYYSLAANQNYPKAQFYLGEIYYVGQYIPQNIKKGIHYYSLAADQNQPDAQYVLGVIYYEGRYTTQDINKSIYYFSLAANQNHPQAQFYLGEIYYGGQYIARDINKAIHYYSLAADQNHPDAQYFLGEIYYQGIYTARDIDKSIHYLSLAANHNHLLAQHNLGFIYHQSKYVTRDIKKAFHYYSLAANQNDPDALYFLGDIYYTGEYMARDINKAIHYYSLAADQNVLETQYILGLIYFNGEYIERDVNKAIHYFSLAANQNYPKAQHALGLIYYESEYVTRDISKAIHYLSLASSQNYSDAQYYLGNIYFYGDYVNRNINKAIHYYSLAADHNHPQAQYSLGFIYYKSMDMKKSIHYLIRSALNGNKEACFAVGYLYHEGKYMERDIDQCIRFYKEASSFNNQYAKNNLGIIYKKGFEDKIEPRLGLSIEYFKEAIKQKNDAVAMYNLGHLYLYEEPINDSINQSIDLLIRSLNEGFLPSLELLCISLIKKYDNDIDSIKQKLEEQTNNFDKYKTTIYKIIEIFISNKFFYELKYLKYKNIDFIYNVISKCILSKEITNETKVHQQNNTKIKDISSEFYEGFGIQLE